jgi:MATE family multidrug resistance protein
MAYALLCALVTVAASRGIVSFFTPDPEVLRVGTATLLVASVLQFINMAYVQLKGVLRGLSQFRYVAWVTVVCAWSITPPLTYLLGVVMDLGAPGAWMTLCIEVSIGLAFLAFRLRSLPAMRVPALS